MTIFPYEFIGCAYINVPYECIGFGAMDDTFPYEFIGFVAICTNFPHEFIGFGAKELLFPL